MKVIDYSNQIQKEAILNECKGNIFEFLVAQGLASRSGVEDHFLMNLPLDFKNKLGSYEELMRTHEPKLLVKLPKLSNLTVKRIWEEVGLDQYQFVQWKVIGKMVATNDNEFWNETDIVGTYKTFEGNEKHLSLSLKLTKDHSYTNTKSAGVKSFLTKYFQAFGDVVINFQKELNSEVDESFLMMGHRLYTLIDREFEGSFNSEWSANHSELPGELPPEMRTIVHENYHRVALKLSGILDQLKLIDRHLFFDSLAALCGFGHSEIIQVSCFHQDYELKEVTIKNYDDFFSKTNKECDLLPIKDLASFVEIIMGKMTLQVRVKPMNKFTTAAYKINCSIKVKA
ncbi:MAG: hypothetical protein PHY93_17120 [Bacteriovorax sp.]|nr:hypothetical protein [Bacteriovorax sp.]